MSKIPQGDWNAIAARYAQGESISRIAQSYGCTPPAIHYILKRSKQRAALNIQQPLQATAQKASTFTHRPPETSGGPEISRAVAPPLAALPGSVGAAPSESRQSMVRPVELQSARGRENAPTHQMPNGRFQSVVEKGALGDPHKTGRPSAFTAGLDSELHARAEAAIAVFRSSFDAALAEGSPHLRQQLRQAASDLMRVAARTTIVLDRLNATAERNARSAEEQPRPAHVR
jgi:hypothetical protein